MPLKEYKLKEFHLRLDVDGEEDEKKIKNAGDD
jgi:hypothetical protein